MPNHDRQCPDKQTHAPAPGIGSAAARGLTRLLTWCFGTRDFDLLTPLSEQQRVLEISSRDFGFGNFLVANGRSRYLGISLVDGGSLAGVRQAYPTLARRIFSCAGARQLAQNNAQTLVLTDAAAQEMWRPRGNRHALHVVWSTGSGIDAWRRTLRFVRDVRWGRFRRDMRFLGAAAWTDAAGAVRVLCVGELLKRKKVTARRFISPALGVQGFFRELQRRRVRYAVLRWFESLPALAPGEDLDLLVADEDIPVVEEMLGRDTGLIPCDLYSVSGLANTAHRSMAYYPPAIARQILDRSIVLGTRIRVPNPEDHFRSLAYHAVYHKGETSGIPTSLDGVQPTATPEHDYAAILSAQARALGIPVAITLEGLDEHLASVGWRPPIDTLGRIAVKNTWVRHRLPALLDGAGTEHHGLAVFLIRQGAIDLGYDRDIVALIRREGFHIVREKTLSPEDARRFRAGARGGNWNAGPYPKSGGSPAIAIVAFDPAPIRPSAAQQAKHPCLDDARVLVKHRVRDLLNDRLPASEHSNMLHSSDNCREAWEYLRLAFPAEIDDLARMLADLQQPHPLAAVATS
jgi:hypothetical protein